MNRRNTDNSQDVVIVGCGRLGAMLASRLSRSGNRVVVIDKDGTAFALIDAGFSGFQVTGDAVEQDVLREAGLEKADCLLATTEKDTLNLMVAQVAKIIFEVPKVLARVYDPKREGLYLKHGIEIISPTSLTGEKFLHLILDEQVPS